MSQVPRPTDWPDDTHPWPEGTYVRVRGRHYFSGVKYDGECKDGSIGIVVFSNDGPKRFFYNVSWVSHPDGFDPSWDEDSNIDAGCLERVHYIHGKATPYEVTPEELDEVYALLGVPAQKSLFDVVDSGTDAK